jgi:hypothetical protein
MVLHSLLGCDDVDCNLSIKRIGLVPLVKRYSCQEVWPG